MHRALRILSVALITAGAVVLADVGVTLAWKEPLSSIYGSIQQGRLSDELDALTEDYDPPVNKKRVRALAKHFEKRIEVGDAIGRVQIPSIDADYVLVHGTDTGTLQRGPGHYPDTRLPGLGGTAGIAGHRTTYLAPFRRIDKVEEGDDVVLRLPYATFTYRVQRHRIVEPTATHIVRDVGYERAVLTACHPLYSAAQRYAVFAKLESVELPAAPGEGASGAAGGLAGAPRLPWAL